MQILFDNGVPRGLAAGLTGHQVEEARDRGWDRLTNGALLVVALSKAIWPLIRNHLSMIARAVAAAAAGSVTEVEIPTK